MTDFYGNILEPKPLIEFELVDQNNERYNLSDIDAEVIMVGFAHFLRRRMRWLNCFNETSIRFALISRAGRSFIALDNHRPMAR